MEDQIVLSSRVRLARNYEDLPFDLSQHLDEADACINRTMNALALAGVQERYQLLRMCDLTENQRQALVDDHRISCDLLRAPQTAAVLLDDEHDVSIMMNEEDHLRIQAVHPGMDLLSAAASCFRVDDALSRQVAFAYDKQLGYLTSCPTNTGTGMRASLMIHLPMLTHYKQMGSVGQIVAKVGLTIRGVYGEGAEALGHVYMVSNQVTLGRTEQEIISTVTAVGHQLCDMERALRQKAMEERRAQTEDTIYRGWGVMRWAHLLPLNEFFKVWSAVRMGAAMELLPVPVKALDELLDQVQDANLRAMTERSLQGDALSEARAQVVRRSLRRAVHKEGD